MIPSIHTTESTHRDTVTIQYPVKPMATLREISILTTTAAQIGTGQVCITATRNLLSKRELDQYISYVMNINILKLFCLKIKKKYTFTVKYIEVNDLQLSTTQIGILGA